MKKSTKVMSLALSALFAFGGLTACGNNGNSGGGSDTKVDEKTIVIKARQAGFGTDWLYELEGKFEEAYKAEGYKVKILTPDNSINGDLVVQELALGYDETKVDLYITSGITPDQVGKDGNYGLLVEDLSDLVYNQTAIAYNGTEESKTVAEKVSSDIMPYMTASTGEKFAYCWAQTSGGLVVNTKKLAKYGLEMPNTTNEMFDCFEQIYCGNDKVGSSLESGTYPITYISGGNGYGVVFLHTLVAQYDSEFFSKLWSFQTTNENGELVNLSDEACQNLYKDPAMFEMLKVAHQAFDQIIAAPGSLSQTVDQAQAKIMDDIVDGAVFMFNGDWMLNEVKLYYPDELHDIDFVNFPVVSALGTKLFGAGTSYGLDEAKCDELLSCIIDHVDENKSIEDIIAGVKADMGIDIAEADAQEVARARGVSYSRGVEHVAYVTKNTPKKDIVGKFLRMMSSDDFGKTFLNVANGSTPYYAAENTTSQYAFVKNASKVTANRYFSLISTFGAVRGYRKQLNILPFFTTVSHLPDHISEKSQATLYTVDCKKNGNTKEVYATAAEALMKSEVANLVDNWDLYRKNAGLN